MENVNEGNKIIAEFMGYCVYPDDAKFMAAAMSHIKQKHVKEYHEDWNYLMPCIEKINKICHDKGYPLSNNSAGQDDLEQPHVDNPLHWKSWSYHSVHNISTDLTHEWNRVVNFITWYTQQQQNQ